MLYNLNILDTLVFLFLYMFIYNLSLFVLMGTFYQFILTNAKTIFSFKDVKLNFLFVILLTFVFFSIAGVPPFIGFFSKLLILLLLINSNFFLFYIFFFVLLFIALYFYLQNIRFLHSTQNSSIAYAFEKNSIRIPFGIIYILLLITFIIIFGFLFFDDILLYFY